MLFSKHSGLPRLDEVRSSPRMFFTCFLSVNVDSQESKQSLKSTGYKWRSNRQVGIYVSCQLVWWTYEKLRTGDPKLLDALDLPQFNKAELWEEGLLPGPLLLHNFPGKLKPWECQLPGFWVFCNSSSMASMVACLRSTKVFKTVPWPGTSDSFFRK